MAKTPITRDSFNRLNEELVHLKKVARPENLAELKQARSYGDLRENAEYDYARTNQGIIEGRIRVLEAKLADSEVVDEIDTSTVMVGVRVRLMDLEFDEELEYRLSDEGGVSATGVESISSESPIGQALMDRAVGDEVEVQVPVGTMRLRILEILTPEE